MLTKTQNEANGMITVIWKWNDKNVREYSYPKNGDNQLANIAVINEIDNTLRLLIVAQFNDFGISHDDYCSLNSIFEYMLENELPKEIRESYAKFGYEISQKIASKLSKWKTNLNENESC